MGVRVSSIKTESPMTSRTSDASASLSPSVRFEKIYQFHRLLSQCRYPVPLKRILEEIKCSKATFYRLLSYLRGEFRAPIEFDRKKNGYFYSQHNGQRFELPGLFFGGRELSALLGMDSLLRQLDAGVLEPLLSPLRERMKALLKSQRIPLKYWFARIKNLPLGARSVDPVVFRGAMEGVLHRRLLWLEYAGLNNQQTTQREVSPQHLVRYRDNWYLDAYCHLRQDLRSFSLNRILQIQVLQKAADTVPANKLEKYFAESYGIFGGPARGRVELIFYGLSARLAAQEIWHPKQSGETLSNGRYKLSFPYGDSRELIKDILRYGDEIEVVHPPSLRAEVVQQIKNAAARYQ